MFYAWFENDIVTLHDDDIIFKPLFFYAICTHRQLYDLEYMGCRNGVVDIYAISRCF